MKHQQAEEGAAEVYISGATDQDLVAMQGFCQARGWQCQAVSRLGRKRVELPVEKLADAYRRTRSIRAAAREVDCPAGTARDRLKDAGLLDEMPPVIT